jgi:Domain of unknown function DUF11
MTARARLFVVVLIAILGGLISAPAYAASGSDLVVGLSNKTDAKAGKRVSYTVTIKNEGPSKARQVKLKFKTSAALRRIKYKIKGGYCNRSPKKIECFISSIKKGKTAVVTLSGIMPKKIKKGTPVTNKVTVTSHTHLLNRANDVATDNYQMGISRAVVVAPTPTPSSPNKIDQANSAAAKVFSFSESAVVITYVVLGAGLLWFIVGLSIRKISRIRRGVTND